ncbi:MAG TPA: radical SAM protein [Acidobacteriota bacterium]|nr:radical SAM protein [Acidobacteriota bacterium]
MGKLRIAEIFKSIQGEGTRAGLPCAFVRLAGCNLRCSYCDTDYAQDAQSGSEMGVDEVAAQVRDFGLPLVQITGGEPLLQPACAELIDILLEDGATVLLETNGSQDISVVDPRVIKIIDLKCPASGESGTIRRENIEQLHLNDEVKFVVSNRGDYEWAREVILRERLAEKCTILLSPASGELEPRKLAEWMLRDRLVARLQLQLHKIIWGDERSR